MNLQKQRIKFLKKSNKQKLRNYEKDSRIQNK